MIVGHNPPMSEIASLLVTTGFGHCSIQLRTGTAAAVVDLPELTKPATGRLVDLLRLDSLSQCKKKPPTREGRWSWVIRVEFVAET